MLVKKKSCKEVAIACIVINFSTYIDLTIWLVFGKYEEEEKEGH